MTTSKSTLIHMNMIDVSNHKMSPREDNSVEFQPPFGEISQQTFNDTLEKDSLHLVKNVPRLGLARLLGKVDDESDSESDDLGEEECFASDVQEGKPKRRSSSSVKQFNLPLKGPAVKRRSSITKYTVPLKETSKPSTRKPSIEGNRTHRILSKSKRTTKKQDFQTRVRDTLGKNSLHLHRHRLQCSNVTTPKAAKK